MGRILKILAYAVILFLVYLVITGFLKSCNNKKDVAAAEVENAIDEDYSGDDYFEDGEVTDTGISVDSDDIFGEEKPSEINYDEIDKALDEKETTAESDYTSTDYTTPPSSTTTTSNVNSGSSTGDFMVIAGSYIINTNAENMVLKLKRMGYNNAEIVIFDMSQYHTVVATRSNDYDDALSLSRELQAKGIDSYVHSKR